MMATGRERSSLGKIAVAPHPFPKPMARHFKIRPPVKATESPREPEPSEPAFDWSPVELEALANVASEADVQDCRAWLTRLGLDAGVALFDA